MKIDKATSIYLRKFILSVLNNFTGNILKNDILYQMENTLLQKLNELFDNFYEISVDIGNLTRESYQSEFFIDLRNYYLVKILWKRNSHRLYVYFYIDNENGDYKCFWINKNLNLEEIREKFNKMGGLNEMVFN